MLISDGEVPEGEDWIYQIKWDGVRCLAYIDGGKVTLHNRSGYDITPSFPDVAVVLEDAIPKNCVLDGEIIVLSPADGRPQFSLANMRAQSSAPIKVKLLKTEYKAVFLPFDILYYNGSDLTAHPLRDRLEILESLNNPNKKFIVPTFFNELSDIQAVVSKNQHEGFVAKHLEGQYLEGGRPKTNVRWKNIQTLDVVIKGWEKGTGVRYKNFGSFICKVLDEQYYGYSVNVSSGFSDSLLKEIIDSLEVTGESDKEIHVKEDLVIEIFYLEIQDDGLVRNPSFARIRADKVPF